MIIKEFEYILKDGRRALIRSPKVEDIDSMLDYLYTSASETDFVLRYPEECSRYTKEKEKELFERINNSSDEVMLVCIVDGKVAGNCDISWNNRIKTSKENGSFSSEVVLQSLHKYLLALYLIISGPKFTTECLIVLFLKP